MGYTCSVCGEKVAGDLIDLKDHTEGHIVEEIKKKNPGWVEEDGVCPKCREYYQTQISGRGERDEDGMKSWNHFRGRLKSWFKNL